MNKKTIILMLVFSSILKLEAQLFGVSERLASIDSSVLLLQIKTAGDAQKLKHFFAQKGLQTGSACSRIFPVHNDHNLSRLYRVKALNAAQARWIYQKLAETGFVVYIEYAPVYHTFLTPNDLHVNQWHLKKINAEQAWDIRTGNAAIKIAIVDDAVDINHEDLKNVIYRNTAEIAGNGVDDDGNGYVDDVNGWQAFYGTGNPNPPVQNRKNFTHGTHCAGIAAAETNNNSGIASIGYGIKLIPVACADSSQPGRIAGGYEGIVYAVDAGADVISLSWGGSGFSQTGQIIIDYATGKDIVVCAASGNDNTNVRMYPAAYNGVIAVAATDVNDRKATFSNYGSWIDVSAPGVNIWSSVTGSTSKYDYLSGTSMACPLTAGLCALMLSQNDRLTSAELEACLKSSSDNINTLNTAYNNLLGAGRINGQRALQCIKPLYTDFSSPEQVLCPGGSVRFQNLSSPSANSYLWRVPGALPATSTIENPTFVFPNEGFYKVSLLVSDGVNSDSLAINAYIEVRAVKAQMATVVQSISSGESAFLTVNLQGSPPWNIKVSDGTSSWSYNGIASSPFYFDVKPAVNTKYYLTEVSDSRCAGTHSDTAYVAVDTTNKTGTNAGGCGSFDLISKTYDLGSRELPHFIHRLRDGNMIIGGVSNKGVIGGDDIFLIKINLKGDVIWTRYIGTNTNETGSPVNMTEDDSFHIYLFGGVFTRNPHTSFLCKLDSSGTVLFSKAANGNSVADLVIDGKQLSNGNMVFVGTSAITNDQAGKVFASNKNGGEIWKHSYNTSGQTEHCIEVLELNKRIYVIGRTSVGSGNYGSFLLKLNLQGNSIWQKYIDYNNWDGGLFLRQTPQSSLISVHMLSYNGASTFGGQDFGVFHSDTNGNRIWSRIIGKSGKDEAGGIVEMNGYYYISGTTTSFDGGNSKLFLVKMDINGNLKWSKIYGSSGEKIIKPIFATLLQKGNDGSLLLTGQKLNATDDVVLFKIDECGKSNCSTQDVVFNISSDSTTIKPAVLADLGLLSTSLLNTSSQLQSKNSVSKSDKCPPLVYKSVCSLKPGFSFTYSCLNDSVRFVDSSQDVSGKKIRNYKWIFHDNSFVLGKKQASFLYTSAGTYKVRLVIFSDTPDVCSDTIEKNINLIGEISAKFNFSSVNVCLNDSVKLSISDICGQSPYSIQWFPALSVSDPTALNTSVTLPSSGYVRFVLTDRSNTQYTDSVYITVNQNCCVYRARTNTSRVSYCIGEKADIQSLNTYSGASSKWFVYIDGVLKDSVSGNQLMAYPLNAIGKYTFRLRISGNCKTSESETEIFVYPLPLADAGRDTVLCTSADVQIGSAAIDRLSYRWTPVSGLNSAEISDPLLSIQGSSVYYVVVKNPETGCENSDSVMITLVEPFLGLGPDTVLCEGGFLRLNAGNSQNNVTFTWNDGSNGPIKTIRTPGVYTVTRTNICGIVSDTVDVGSKVCFCELFIPNAFSPDGNAINDYFPEHHLDTIISIQIFNRWGEKLFEQENTRIGWDGTYKGSIVQQDVYLYLIEYRTCKGRYEYLHGTFTLLR